MRLKSLNTAQNAVLQGLGRMAFATANQLQYWSGLSLAPIRKALVPLQEANFIQATKSARPHIFRLTRSGARVVDTALPSGGREPSWSVLTHTCHKNQVEIVLRQSLFKFKFLNKSVLLRLGLNPSFGEHAAFVDGKIVFVLLDDYLMPSYRIQRAAWRFHVKNTNYCDLNVALTWQKVYKRFLIATTDKNQEKKHARWIKRNQFNAELVYVQPLWTS